MGKGDAVKERSDHAGAGVGNSGPDSGSGVLVPAANAGGAVAVPSETAAILSMIERAARDPAVDVDKMERLFTMQQQAAERRAKVEYDTAFAAMQPEMPEIDKRGKIVIKAKDGDKIIQSTPYALWDDTNRLIKPILAKFGFGLSFRMTQTADRLTTTAVLSHVSGHREETSFSAPIDSTGSKNNVQGWGSSFSYGKRYSATALLNITTRGEDDDGKAAGATAPSENAAATLANLIKEASDPNATTSFLCEKYSVETLEDLTGKQIAEAIAGLHARKRQVKK